MSNSQYYNNYEPENQDDLTYAEDEYKEEEGDCHRQEAEYG